ncbi:MAG: hypothetical protein ACLUPK_01820 [Veillonella sp.]
MVLLLSIKASATDRLMPIKFTGVSEKMDGFRCMLSRPHGFSYPQTWATFKTLIRKMFKGAIDEEEAREMAKQGGEKTISRPDDYETG